MTLQFVAHWLAFMWAVTKKSELTAAVKKGRSAGATGFELIYHVLNGLSPSKTAAALKAGGMWQAFMCIFFPGDASMGDPLGEGASYAKALATFRRVIAFIVRLRTHGIKIDMIVGPSCWALGRAYDMDWTEKKRRIIGFYTDLAPELQAAGIRVAIEHLRGGEDRVIESPVQWKELIEALNAAITGVQFGAHFDTHHMLERGYSLVGVIRLLGKLIIHLHFNGTLRRPAGGEGDTVEWRPVVDTLHDEGVDNLGCANEPFCALVRLNCSELGDGLPPPVDEPGGMVTTRKTLEANGVTILAA